MKRIRRVLLATVVLTLPVVVFGLTRLWRNGNSAYYRCTCIGVAVSPNEAPRIAGSIDEGRCIGVTIQCERCCRCF